MIYFVLFVDMRRLKRSLFFMILDFPSYKSIWVEECGLYRQYIEVSINNFKKEN